MTTSRSRNWLKVWFSFGVAGGHLARVHLIDAIHQIQSGSAPLHHFAVQIIAAAAMRRSFSGMVARKSRSLQ